MSLTLENKVIWITGASSGIGEALAYALANEGAKLVLSARREKELERVAAGSGLSPENILVLPLDLEHTARIEEKTAAVLEKFGKIDILVNNSGMGHRTKAVNTPTEIDRRIMEINFFGTVNLSKSVARVMLKQKHGKIAVITSIMGKYGLPLYSAYAASKHALYGYFESLRQELYKDNVQVQIIAPGFINTEVSTKLLTEDGTEYGKKSDAQEKGMKPADCANRIVNALKSTSDHAYIGGYEILSVYVKQYFPRLFYRLMRKMTKD